MDALRDYGRMGDAADYADWRVQGMNPCGEQGLESGECCTLADVIISRHETEEDFLETLKVAYLYAKTVTLLPTHWERTNAIMQRNRRIGLSLSGITDFVDAPGGGLRKLREWTRRGYDRIRCLDRTYSEWLCVRESIRRTTIKPGGTTGIVLGASPGAHWRPGSRYVLRTVRMSVNNPQVTILREHGYRVEADRTAPETTVVVYFPLQMEEWKRTEQEVSLLEKAALAMQLQRDWSDNAVSVTLSFDREREGHLVPKVLEMVDGQMKSISFLPYAREEIYPQAPFMPVSKEEYEREVSRIRPIEDMGSFYQSGIEAKGEQYCTTDACEIRRP
jgi:adenosylcobalamin-dependent ribonucleoside-triphosphate reductase